MPSWLGRTILFLSSYLPLFAIFVLLFWEQKWVVAVGLGACLVGAVGLYGYLRIVANKEPIEITPIDVRRSDSEAMSYIVTYILPFAALSFDEPRNAIALLVFFIVLGIIYVNSNMIHINPVLNLLQYKLYEVELKDGQTHSLLSRRRVVRNEPIDVAKLDEDILFYRGAEL